MSELKEYLLQKSFREDQIGDCLQIAVPALLQKLFVGAINKLQPKFGMFELFACDILIDRELKPFLMNIKACTFSAPHGPVQSPLTTQLVAYLNYSSVQIALDLMEEGT